MQLNINIGRNIYRNVNSTSFNFPESYTLLITALETWPEQDLSHGNYFIKNKFIEEHKVGEKMSSEPRKVFKVNRILQRWPFRRFFVFQKSKQNSQIISHRRKIKNVLITWIISTWWERTERIYFMISKSDLYQNTFTQFTISYIFKNWILKLFCQ